MRLKVVTFNMQFGQAWDDEDPDNAPVSLDRTIPALLEHDADIVFLQEVEQVRPEVGQVQPPPNYERLKRELSGYHGVFTYPPEDDKELPFGYGLAIFSKTPLENIEAIPLPAPNLEFEFEGKRMRPTQRVMLAARTQIEGRELRLLNVHLQSFFIIGQSSNDHPEQRRAVAHRLKEVTEPTLLAGDFNAAPGEGTLEEFEALNLRTLQQKSPTWRRMPYVLDHIMHSRDFEPCGCKVAITSASDHMIVVGELELKRDETVGKDAVRNSASAAG